MPAIVDLPDGRRVPLSAMRKRATRRRVAPPKQRPVTTRLSGDAPQQRAADNRKVATFKQTPQYRGAVRKAYNTQPIPQRHQAVTYAHAHPSREGQIVTKLHQAR